MHCRAGLGKLALFPGCSWVDKSPSQQHTTEGVVMCVTDTSKHSSYRFTRRLCTSIRADLPSRAQVVVCGGGVAGSSVALHLSQLDFKDVVHLEQGRYVHTRHTKFAGWPHRAYMQP